MLCPRQIRFVTLCWLLLLIRLGSSSVAASVSKTDDLEYSIVLRTDSPNRKIDPRDLGITAEGHPARVVSVADTSVAHLSIAVVVDAGPNQAAVLNREKELASSLIAEFSDTKTDFIVIRAGHQTTKISTSFAAPFAKSSLQAFSAETGKKSRIPVYKGVALAIEELSVHPGIRALIVIAEGNDFRSGISYQQLRASAQAQHVSVMTALVADHSTRGSKAILSYGWDLQSLAGDTAGVFIDNERNTPRVVKRLTQAIRSLRLVTFEIDGVSLGRHRMHTSSNSAGRLHAQKDVFIESPNCEQGCCRGEGSDA